MVASCRALAVVLGLVALGPALAYADSKAPWADGVSDEAKAKARGLLEAGNALLVEKKYVEALDRYQRAIESWDHPAIRFNMVRCFIQLGKNLEAYESLDKALAYGAAPLEETVYNEALAYQKLLASQVGQLSVRCAQPGVTLTLDGQPLGACPLESSQRVLAGAHQIVGTKKGLLTRTVEIAITGGAPHDVTIQLDPLAKAAKITHRWPQWMPYTVFGGGVAIAGVGALFQVLGSQQMKDYDRWVDTRCTGNCQPSELADVADLKSGAELKSAVGVTLMVAGGATVVTGAVLIYLNRGRTVYPEQLQVAPTPGGAAVSWSGRF